MIKANELRIGNYIQATEPVKEAGNKNFMAVELDILAVVQEHPDVFFGIPLTPEILEKCGFENAVFFEGIRTGVYNKNGLKIGLHGDDFVNAQYTAIFGEDVCVKVKYLHELQNLYYALTGEELTIEL